MNSVCHCDVIMQHNAVAIFPSDTPKDSNGFPPTLLLHPLIKVLCLSILDYIEPVVASMPFSFIKCLPLIGALKWPKFPFISSFICRQARVNRIRKSTLCTNWSPFCTNKMVKINSDVCSKECAPNLPYKMLKVKLEPQVQPPMRVNISIGIGCVHSILLLFIIYEWFSFDIIKQFMVFGLLIFRIVCGFLKIRFGFS